MNLKLLISLVFKRKPLWNKKLKVYRNKVIAEKLWRQIADELGEGVTTYEIKKRWKSLRNQFGKELRKVPDEVPDDYETYTTWQYFESMLFLKDHMKPRKAGENWQPDDTEIINTQETGADEIKIDHNELLETPDLVDINHTDENDAQPQRRTPKRSAQHCLIDFEANKLQLLGHNMSYGATADDEDEAFFKSLLPHVRKLPPEEKLLFRTEVQNVVHKFVYQKNRLPNDPKQSHDDFQASTNDLTY